ncbi:LPS export ABC transporter periplasmic protein LptC [Roseateles oligotrophus]|uniref:LPS export ABC transporter periplasmic protein LptC n=1 Tax=Roseateles oligotrophus TaxID=1769250 RepID=A0ABT2YKS7_9BURK|nr:LPS export ABC transporter periplasmic protein LptC [Roseateles oligotrophus]MCV2370661.1 LPS export ABC transporter periplasmic protein LptC [Roseateles oligotrophus]
MAKAARLAPPPAPVRPRLAKSWLWRLQSLLANYLPLLLMAFLASGTWWLVKNTPTPDGVDILPPPRHEPDYQMKNFDLQRVGADGLMRVRIEGLELRHYPDTDTLEIDGISLRTFGSDGGVTLAKANRAISNSDGSELQLLGAVHVQRFDQVPPGQPAGAPKLEVRGEFLHAFVNTETLRSHLPVQLNYAGAELKAQSFEFNYLTSRLSFGGNTQARFEAPASTQRSKKAKPS